MNDSIIDTNLLRYYSNDILDLSKHPNNKVSDFYNSKNNKLKRKLDLSNLEINIKKEIHNYLEYCFKLDNITIKNLHSMYISKLIKFIPSIRNTSIKTLRDLDKVDYSKFLDSKPNRVMYFHLKRFILNFYDTREMFEKDLWEVSNLNLSKERLNNTRNIRTINFNIISNQENKILLKKYIKYLLKNTDISLSTIISKLSKLKNFLVFLDVIKIKDISRESVLSYYEYLSIKYSNSKTYNEHVYRGLEFCEYLELNDFIEKNYFYIEDTRKNLLYDYKETSVERYVIDQIFNCLDKVDETIRLIFLIIYCTGMRVSEACQIKINCLQKTNDAYFIIFYSQKMKKEATNVIPQNLYNLIVEYRSKISNSKQEYLFVSAVGSAYQASTFSDKFNKALEKFEIINSDGSVYRFRPHDYRHTMGSKMREREIPFQYIQRQLHHESPEMTLAYIEYNNKQKIKKMNEFIDVNGDNAPLKSTVKLDDEEAYAEWTRKFINTQMLPNGVCAKPIKLGKCQHANSCLTCLDFRTSVKDLETHKLHLQRVEEYINFAKKNGWTMQLETNKKTRENLIKIIKKLEG